MTIAITGKLFKVGRLVLISVVISLYKRTGLQYGSVHVDGLEQVLLHAGDRLCVYFIGSYCGFYWICTALWNHLIVGQLNTCSWQTTGIKSSPSKDPSRLYILVGLPVCLASIFLNICVMMFFCPTK